MKINAGIFNMSYIFTALGVAMKPTALLSLLTPPWPESHMQLQSLKRDGSGSARTGCGLWFSKFRLITQM
jgi:hypothetical protein